MKTAEQNYNAGDLVMEATRPKFYAMPPLPEGHQGRGPWCCDQELAERYPRTCLYLTLVAQLITEPDHAHLRWLVDHYGKTTMATDADMRELNEYMKENGDNFPSADAKNYFVAAYIFAKRLSVRCRFPIQALDHYDSPGVAVGLFEEFYPIVSQSYCKPNCYLHVSPRGSVRLFAMQPMVAGTPLSVAALEIPYTLFHAETILVAEFGKACLCRGDTCGMLGVCPERAFIEEFRAEHADAVEELEAFFGKCTLETAAALRDKVGLPVEEAPAIHYMIASLVANTCVLRPDESEDIKDDEALAFWIRTFHDLVLKQKFHGMGFRHILAALENDLYGYVMCGVIAHEREDKDGVLKYAALSASAFKALENVYLQTFGEEYLDDMLCLLMNYRPHIRKFLLQNELITTTTTTTTTE